MLRTSSNSFCKLQSLTYSCLCRPILHSGQQQQQVRNQSGMNKASALSLTSKKRRGQRITMVTAYDYPSAVHVSRAGIDIVLVGDSAAMVEMGFSTTQPVSMEQMLHHCQNAKRGIEYANVSPTPMLIGDMPFGSYEFEDSDVALSNAYRFVKEAGVDAVKIEVGCCQSWKSYMVRIAYSAI